MERDTVAYTRQDNSRRTTLEGQLLDEAGNPIPQTRGWRQLPQQSRVRRLQPYGRPDAIDDLDYQNYLAGQQAGAQGGTHVTVNNGGQFYRPWKEEILISFVRTIGNFLGWPFRLVGRFIENIVTMAAGVLKIMLLAVVLPSLLFAGYSFYESNKDRPATETAAEVGRSGVQIVGAAIGGIWDAIFGSDEPEPAKAPEKSEATPPQKAGPARK